MSNSKQTKAEHSSLISEFWQAVENKPDQIALVDGLKSLNYAQLGHEANQIAHTILESRHQSESRVSLVAIFIDHNHHAIKAILATLLAGCAYQPIDTHFPDERIKKLLDISQPHLLVTTQAHRARVIELVADGVEVLCVDDVGMGQSKEKLHTALSIDAPAYLLSTSGSTGEPKSVLHSHKGLLRGASHYRADLSVSNVDHIALILPLTYTPSIFCIFGALLSGASLHMFDLKSRSIEDMASWVITEQITLLYSSPTIFRRLLRGYADELNLSSLRSIQLAGEPLYTADVDMWREKNSQKFFLYNGMGTTEISCFARFFIFTDTEFEGAQIPVGTPYEDSTYKIVDENNTPVADGEEGQLVVYGDYLPAGYFERPDLSEGKFIPVSEGEALPGYRTGDLVKRSTAGHLIHLGRADGQVKLRGQRVELSEVEAWMLKSGLATEAVVIHKKEVDNDYLCAFFQPESSIRDMRKYLSSVLPPFMIPTRLLSMAELPTNHSGKVDRLALQNLSFSTSEGKITNADSVIEQRVVECFKTILKNDQVGATTNFFDLGGDSLNAVELSIEIQRRLSVPINASTLIEAPTPRSLAKEVRQLLSSGNAKSLVRFDDREYCAKRAADEIPIFCVPGMFGDAMSFRALASKMLPTRAVYAIEYPGYNGEEITYRTLDELVTLCFDDISAAYPQGPIALVSYSLGGTVAFELCKKLRAAGREIRSFVMLDCYSPAGIKMRHARDEFIKSLKQAYRRIRRLDDLDLRTQRNNKANKAVTQSIYHFKPTPGDIPNALLVLAKDQPKPLGFIDNYKQWSKLIVSGLETLEVAGTHLSLIHPDKAETICQIINNHIGISGTKNESLSTFESLQDQCRQIWEFQSSGHDELEITSANLESFDPSQLNLLQHVGQLTERIEAHLQDEIEPEVISSQQLGRYYYRKVVLRTVVEKKVVVLAAIRVAMDNLPREAIKEIVSMNHPFGKILKRNNIEYKCTSPTLFHAELKGSAANLIGGVASTLPLKGRKNQFRDKNDRVMADVFEILSPTL